MPKKQPAVASDVRSNPPVNMNLREAAAYLGVSPRKLWDLANDGDVKAARIGARLIFPRSALDHYVALLLAAC